MATENNTFDFLEESVESTTPPNLNTKDSLPIKKRKKSKGHFINFFYFFLIIIIIGLFCMAYMMNNYETDYSGILITDESTERTKGSSVPTQSQQNNTSSKYDSVPYAREDLLERYIAHHDLYPNMSTPDVVWEVNANLDKLPYGFDIEVNTYDNPHMLVNKYYKVPDDYCPDDMMLVDGLLVRKDTGNMFTQMRDVAAADGISLKISSAYVSVEEQKEIYNEYLITDIEENIDRYCARPGYSEHHTGMAIDVTGADDNQQEFASTPEYQWLIENCHKYGFIIRYKDETEDITGFRGKPNHLRYVGVEASTYMYENNISTLEEYIAKNTENN